MLIERINSVEDGLRRIKRRPDFINTDEIDPSLLDRMTHRQRTAFMLHFVLGATKAGTARAMGIKYGVAYKHIEAASRELVYAIERKLGQRLEDILAKGPRRKGRA